MNNKTKSATGKDVSVLSLFDGMACGMLAFIGLGINVKEYYAYEIDKYAIKTTQHNFPNIKQCGDVFDADFTQYENIDFLIGGSPCTYWSIAQKNDRRETEASGLGWELFSQYVRALKEAKPKYFIYENNKSMAKAIYESISNTFGFEPILINSALVSAQNRNRYYWCGIRNDDGTYRKADIPQPEDRGILLRDVLDGNDLTCSDKSYAVTAPYNGAVPWNTIERHQRNMVAEPVSTRGKDKSSCLRASYYKIGNKRNLEENIINGRGYEGVIEPLIQYAEACEWHDGKPTKAISSADGKKYIVYTVLNGVIEIKGKSYPIKLADGFYIIRKLTVSECKRLQTVPEWYDFSVISDSQAYKCLGNGWTVEVISHILKGLIQD